MGHRPVVLGPEEGARRNNVQSSKWFTRSLSSSRLLHPPPQIEAGLLRPLLAGSRLSAGAVPAKPPIGQSRCCNQETHKSPFEIPVPLR